MEGYEVISAVDDKSIGHVVGKANGNLIVEHGTLRKTRNALPLAFAEVDEANQRVVTTLAAELVHASPKVEHGAVDEQAVAAHYGLADTIVPDSELDNLDELGADADAYRAGREPEAERLAEVEEHLGQAVPGPADASPALLGDHYTEVPREEEEDR